MPDAEYLHPPQEWSNPIVDAVADRFEQHATHIEETFALRSGRASARRSADTVDPEGLRADERGVGAWSNAWAEALTRAPDVSRRLLLTRYLTRPGTEYRTSDRRGLWPPRRARGDSPKWIDPAFFHEWEAYGATPPLAIRESQRRPSTRSEFRHTGG